MRRIVSVGNDDILEDLNSANGTLVNGTAVATHILQQDDVIEIVDYRIRYRSHTAVDGPSFDRTMVIKALVSEHAAPATPVGVHALATARRLRPLREGDRVGIVKALDGPHAGEEIELLGLLRTFGVAGKQVAVVNRRPSGYFITHVEGRKPARVNGKSIGTDPRPLQAERRHRSGRPQAAVPVAMTFSARAPQRRPCDRKPRSGGNPVNGFIAPPQLWLVRLADSARPFDEWSAMTPSPQDGVT